jgi:hypothetical protein
MRVVCFREFEDALTKTGDSGRITRNPEVIPADPIRAITSGFDQPVRTWLCLPPTPLVHALSLQIA